MCEQERDPDDMATSEEMDTVREELDSIASHIALTPLKLRQLDIIRACVDSMSVAMSDNGIKYKIL